MFLLGLFDHPSFLGGADEDFNGESMFLCLAHQMYVGGAVERSHLDEAKATSICMGS